MRILLIGERLPEAERLRESLATGGERVEVASAGTLSEGFGAAESSGFDVALLELDLPDVRGLETLERFSSRAPDLPVVVLAARYDGEAAAAALSRGAQDYLVAEGVSGPQVLRALRHAAERGRRIRSLRPPSEGGELEERSWSPLTLPVPGPDGEIRFLAHRVDHVTAYVRERVGAEGGPPDLELDALEERREADPILRAREIEELNRHLEASEQRFRRAFAGAATGIAITSTDGRFEYVNPAYTRLVGRREEDLAGTDVLSITHPDDRSENEGLVRELLDGKRESFVIEKRYVRPDGREVWAQVSVGALPDPGGVPAQLIAVAENISERKAAEARLGESERLLAIAGRTARLGGWSVDLNAGVVHWSDEVCEIHDMPPRTVVVPEEGIRFYTPESRPVIREHFRRCVEEGAPYDLELEIVTAKGRRRWVRTIGQAVRDEGGEVVRVDGAFQDITEELEAESRLRESEERFRLVARATSDVIWDWDLRTDTLWWSDGMARTFGHPPHALPGDLSAWKEFVHPKDRARVEAGLEEVIEGSAESWSDEYRFRRADGTHAFVSDQAFVIRDDDGRGVRMVGGISDETSYVEAHRRLEEQAALLEKAQDAIVVRELDGTVAFWNPAAERLYGWTAREALGRSVQDLVGADEEGHREAMTRVVEDGEWAGEMEHRRKDGSPLTVEARLTLVRDGRGRPSRILSINTDVTEKKKLTAQFLRSQRIESIGTLAGGIAHDLNNVLAPILMSIDLLRDGLDDPEARETLESIGSSARRGADLVRQVLSFSRGVKGSRVPVDLVRILHDLGRVIRDTFPKNIRFVPEVPEDLWRVTGDPTQIHQVLLNLAVNARDAMPEGGTLEIRLENVTLDRPCASLSGEEACGAYVRISVVDSGVGIPRALLDRIFDPFFTTKAVDRGTGLGLSTVAAILKSHDGFVNVSSEEAKGSTFQVHLPAGPAGTEDPDLGTERAPRRGKGELILVVDDEASVRTITRRTLEANGFQVLTATDGADAVGIYGRRGREIDLVLTDLAMPIMDGAAAIRALRRMNPDLKIIAASGLGARGGVSRATDLGVDRLLPKPFTATALLDVLQRVLDDDA